MDLCANMLVISVQVNIEATHYTFVTGSGSTFRDLKSWSVNDIVIEAETPTERQKEYGALWPLYGTNFFLCYDDLCISGRCAFLRGYWNPINDAFRYPIR